MHKKIYRNVTYLVLTLFSLICLHLFTAPPSQAHWADMAAAEIWVEEAAVRFNLTYPTGLTPFADDDQNGQLSAHEIEIHRGELQSFLGKAIQLQNSDSQPAQLSLSAAQSTGQAAPNSHSRVQLVYSWPQPVQGLKIHYNLFLPGVSTASCLATILQNQQLQTFVFTPNRQVLALAPSSRVGLLLALAGALVWGAMHSLSPGHGKTLVGAYLVGSRATAGHALALALTTTATHTVGIFALGLVTLFASRYILPEQLYPWMNLASGLIVVMIGLNLLKARLKRQSHRHAEHSHGHHGHHDHGNSHSHSHDLSGHGQDSDYWVLASAPAHTSDHYSHPHHKLAHSNLCHTDHHEHHHAHSHHHPQHDYVHLTPDTPITWRNLLLLGVSGGLVPCPAALVLLLSCVALGQLGLGLLMVTAFSLGLAGVLTGLGLLMVYAKQRFNRPGAAFLPKFVSQFVYQFIPRFLPAASAIAITLIGTGLVSQAVLQLVKPL